VSGKVPYKQCTMVTGNLSRRFTGARVEIVASTHDESAPGELELVRTFINTGDLLREKEDLAAPAALRAWLAERGLIDAAATVTQEGVAQAHAVREALRALAEANGGAPCGAAELATLRDAAARAPLQITFDPASTTRLEPIDRGIDGALGRLLAIVHRAMESGEWRRVKACRDAGCRWAFYDHSKNRSGTWCDMASCGNRNKARRRRAQA
jgi:predicted RNA-binding Zn ribbon-like protein